jgi:hypothetical protein
MNNNQNLGEFQNIRQFSFSWQELNVQPSDVEFFMGFHREPAHEPFPELIAQAFSEAEQLFEIKAGYREIEDVQFLPATRQIAVNGQILTTGSIIFRQIRKSVKVVLFASTAGEAVTTRSRQVNRDGDMIYSYVLDSLGSVVAEKAVDKMMEIMEEEASASGWHISESYSPGYCNWDVAEQQKLFSFFPEKFCGITLSPSSLMHPVKSISGIIGIGPAQTRNGYKCLVCHDKNCIYGRIRRQNHISARH